MNNLTRLFRSLKHVLIERSLLPLLRCLFDCLIGFVFVQIPLLIDSIINPDEFQKRRSKQQRIRSKLTDESDRKSAYRAIEVLDQLQNQPEEQIETLADIPRVCLSRFADKETMGIRPIINVQQEKQPNGKVFKKFAFGEYQFSSYRQICHRIDLIGRGLLSIGVEPGDRILIFSETRPEWLMTAFAGFTHRFTVVTLIPTLDQQGVLHGIQESNVKLILTSQELFNKLNKIINQIENQIEHIVYFPARADIDSKAKVESEKIEMIPLDKLEQIGKNAQLDENLLKQRPKKEDLAVIMYTSGSTGPPKGTSIRHENIIAAMTGQKQRAYPIIDVEHDVFICYLPLGHIFELCCEILIFYLGVKSGYGTPQTLASESTAVQKGQQGDLQALRPHLMGGVPTIFERMHQAIYGQIKQSNIFLRLIFDFCFAIKRKRMEYGLQTPILDRFLFSRFNKKALGGRLKVILSGGAILSEETQRFAQCALCVQVLQGYGLTETCGGGTIADHQEIDVGRAGYPIVSAEIRLIDWEEGQYRTTDKPNPRGEILIGGKIVADSYFGDAQEENDNFKEIEGIKYFYTGDIGQIFPDGTIQIIDRKKDVVKIENGEYVSLAKVEMSIKKLLLVDNCCVCASDKYNHTVALIVPNTKEICSYAKKHFNQDDWKQIANDEDFNDQIRRQIHDACKTNGIQNYEIPKSILIVTEPWSPESGLVNDALKLKRKAIQQHYKQQIEQLYKGNIQQQQDKKQK